MSGQRSYDACADAAAAAGDQRVASLQGFVVAHTAAAARLGACRGALELSLGGKIRLRPPLLRVALRGRLRERP